MTTAKLPHEIVRDQLNLVVVSPTALGLLGQHHDDLPWSTGEEAIGLYHEAGKPLPPPIHEVIPEDFSIKMARTRETNEAFFVGLPKKMAKRPEMAEVPFRGTADIQ